MSRYHADLLRLPTASSAVVAHPDGRAIGTGRRAGGLLAMQRRHGNRQVARWVAARTVGSPTDPAEREAERVARAVSGTAPTPGVHRDDVPTGPIAPAVRAGIAAARGRGRPLPGDVRARVEGALGADLGEVRLHTGPGSAALGRALGARAFTTGNDVFLRDGADRPDSSRARGVLAHELTHVAQQQADAGAPIRRVLDPDHLDHEPDETVEADEADEAVEPEVWFTPSGWFDYRGGATPGVASKVRGKSKRAGTVEAVIPARPLTGGTRPKKETLLGWYWVHQFGGTRPANGSWVRFHLLNEQLGGRGTSKLNLVPTTQATNQDARWTTRFDDVANAAHDDGEHLHFIASVDYYPPVAAPAQPGERFKHFFPRRIEAEYRVWRDGRWEDLVDADLQPIAPPPMNPAIVSVYLASASDKRLTDRCRGLDAKFATILSGAKRKFAAMAADSTLEDVYELVSEETLPSLTIAGKYLLEADARRKIDVVRGWWPALEAALLAPQPNQRLSVNYTIDLAGSRPVETETMRLAAEQEKARRAESRASGAERRREVTEKNDKQKQFFSDFFS